MMKYIILGLILCSVPIYGSDAGQAPTTAAPGGGSGGFEAVIEFFQSLIKVVSSFDFSQITSVLNRNRVHRLKGIERQAGGSQFIETLFNVAQALTNQEFVTCAREALSKVSNKQFGYPRLPVDKHENEIVERLLKRKF